MPETIRADDSPPEVVPKDKGTEYESRRTLGERLKAPFAKGRDIVRELLGDVEADRLLRAVPADAALEVTVNIGYRATRRKFGKEFMGNIAAGLRNVPDGELRVRGKDGELKGDDARLSADMTIRKLSETSGLLDLEHALSQMLEVHRRFLHDGKIVS